MTQYSTDGRLPDSEYTGTSYDSDPVADLIDALGAPAPLAPARLRPAPAGPQPPEYAGSARLIMTQSEIDADKALWLEERRRAGNGRDGARAGGWRLTASEMAAVLGLAPPGQGSAFSLYYAKQEPGGGGFSGNDRTDLGLYLEDLVAAKFAAAHPELELGGGGLYVSKAYPWLAATFDRIAYAAQCDHGCPVGAEREDCPGDVRVAPYAPVQIKSWARREDFGDAGSAVMPVYLRVQCLTEMIVLGTDLVYLPVIFLPGGKVVTFVIERGAPDVEADIDALLRGGAEFIGCLDEELPPEVDWTPATTAALKRLYPRLTEGEQQIPQALAARVLAADRALKRAERRKAQAMNELRQRCGSTADAVALEPGTGLVRRVAHRRGNPVAGYSVAPVEWREYVDLDRSWGQ